MAHEEMEYSLEMQLEHHAAEQPAPAEVAGSQEGPSPLQPLPAEVAASHGGPPPLQPAPRVSADLTEEVERLGEDGAEDVHPGASEERGQGPGVNRPVQVASLESMNSFLSGLQRLHGMLEFLRPPSDNSVGPVRARRTRGSASRRSRPGASQRTDRAR